jgi:P pilus assembly chaperone PapD
VSIGTSYELRPNNEGRMDSDVLVNVVKTETGYNRTLGKLKVDNTGNFYIELAKFKVGVRTPAELAKNKRLKKYIKVFIQPDIIRGNVIRDVSMTDAYKKIRPGYHPYVVPRMLQFGLRYVKSKFFKMTKAR